MLLFFSFWLEHFGVGLENFRWHWRPHGYNHSSDIRHFPLESPDQFFVVFAASNFATDPVFATLSSAGCEALILDSLATHRDRAILRVETPFFKPLTEDLVKKEARKFYEFLIFPQWNEVVVCESDVGSSFDDPIHFEPSPLDEAQPAAFFSALNSGKKTQLVARLSDTEFPDDAASSNVAPTDNDDVLHIDDSPESESAEVQSSPKRLKASDLHDLDSSLSVLRPGPSASPTVPGHIQFCGIVKLLQDHVDTLNGLKAAVHGVLDYVSHFHSSERSSVVMLGSLVVAPAYDMYFVIK